MLMDFCAANFRNYHCLKDSPEDLGSRRALVLAKHKSCIMQKKKKNILLRPFPLAKLCILLRCSNAIRNHYIIHFSYLMFIQYLMKHLISITMYIHTTEWSELCVLCEGKQLGREHNVQQLSSPLQEKRKVVVGCEICDKGVLLRYWVGFSRPLPKNPLII